MASNPPPDPSSPGAVAGASFPTARKGFDPAAVRAFLSQVSQELGRLQHDRDRLARDLDDARQQARVAAPEDLDEATVAAKLGEEAARVLSTAHEAAAQIRARAEDTSSRLLRDAELEAARQRGDAELEAAHRRQQAEEAADAEIEAAKAQGRAMVAEARDLRERIFADLTRRRDLARQQIETLQIGNRQVMDALRGARLELDGILSGLEVETADDLEDDDLDSLDLPGGGTGLGGPDTAVLVLGEIDLPAVIVERHLESVPTTPDDDVELEEELDAEDLEDEVDDEFEGEDEVDADDELRADDDDQDEHEDVDADVIEIIEVVEVEVVEVEVVDGDQITDEVPVVEGAESGDASASVDDLFARLRAASSDVVARDVLEAEDTGSASAVEDLEDAAEGGVASSGSGAQALASRQEALSPVRVALARQLKRVLADEQNEVLDRLRQRSASLAADDVLGPAAAHPGTYREAAEDHLWSAAVAGAGALSDLEGEELHAALEARSVLDRSLDTLEAELVTPMRARLVENLEAAEDPAEAAALVRATYRDWKGRIDELGADLVRTAYGRAAYAVLAPGTPVCWVFDPSGPACADAEDNVLAGAVPSGEPFPTGHRYAPAYRGCRCLLVVAPG